MLTDHAANHDASILDWWDLSVAPQFDTLTSTCCVTRGPIMMPRLATTFPFGVVVASVHEYISDPCRFFTFAVSGFCPWGEPNLEQDGWDSPYPISRSMNHAYRFVQGKHMSLTPLFSLASSRTRADHRHCAQSAAQELPTYPPFPVFPSREETMLEMST